MYARTIVPLFVALFAGQVTATQPTESFDKALQQATAQTQVQIETNAERNATLREELEQTQARLEALRETLRNQDESIATLKRRLEDIERVLPENKQLPSRPGKPSSRGDAIWIAGACIALALLVGVGAIWLRTRRQNVQPSLPAEPEKQVRLAFGLQVRFTTALALLYIPTGLVRGMMISLLPLQTLSLLGSAQKVSVFYFLIGIGGIAIALTLPRLTRRYGSRRVFEFGAVSAIVSMILLTFDTKLIFFMGMLLHVIAVAFFEIALMLFLLGALKREEYKFFEPYRVVCSTVGFVIGPVASIYLFENVAEILPFTLTALCAVVAWIYVRRLNVGHVGASSSDLSANPIAYIRRFFSQPRLTLAWSVSLVRYAWWVMFFIYVPIYAASTELGALVGGLLVSAGMGATWLAPLWARMGRRIGLRNLFFAGCMGSGLLSLLAFATAGYPVICAVTLFFAAIAATLPDGASHIPFYRAARQRERAEMTGVYAVHRDAGQLVPPTAFAFLLKFFPLPAVFVTGGLMMLAIAPLCRRLPRRM